MKNKKINRSKISKKRRNNAILYPIYKMFSWDLLSFYSVEFLFYTITKGLTASQVLLITSAYIIGKILFQIPSVAISDYIGKKKSMIIGNLILVIYMIMLILSPNIYWIIVVTALSGFGYDIKAITEGNLLYDSVATHGGDGIYTRIDSKGASAYYILDTILSIIAGYLFVINNYIPLIICLIFLVISLILSFQFKDIHRSKKEKTGIKFNKFISGYSNDLKASFKFIKRSNRMKSYILFASLFYGIVKIMSTYRSDLLTNMGIGEEQFTMIYAVLSLISAVSAMFSKKVQKYFKNKTLKVISLSYIVSMIFTGIVALKITNNIAVPLVLIFFSIMKIGDSQWYVTEYTYLRNFTTHESRTKITFTFELIVGISASLLSILGSIILEHLNIQYAILVLGLLSLALITIVLDYMKTRFGLKPSQYTKADIQFKESRSNKNVKA